MQTEQEKLDELKEKDEKAENLWIVIAAYNEEKKIGSVISSLIQQNYKNILVVDDCSTDKTGEVAADAGAIVLKHVINRGQGATLKTGIDFAIENNASIIVTFDADGQHLANEIQDIIMPIKKGDADACIGSRFLGKKSNVPLHRKLMLKAGAFSMWVFYGIHVTDSHNGFRAFRREALEKMKLSADRMEHASEILEQIAEQNIKYKEVPVTISYTNYSLQKGQSSFAAITILWDMIKNKILR